MAGEVTPDMETQREPPDDPVGRHLPCGCRAQTAVTWRFASRRERGDTSRDPRASCSCPRVTAKVRMSKTGETKGELQMERSQLPRPTYLQTVSLQEQEHPIQMHTN